MSKTPDMTIVREVTHPKPIVLSKKAFVEATESFAKLVEPMRPKLTPEENATLQVFVNTVVRAQSEYSHVDFLNEFVLSDPRWADEWADDADELADACDQDAGEKFRPTPRLLARVSESIKGSWKNMNNARHKVMRFAHAWTHAPVAKDEQKEPLPAVAAS